MKKINTTLGRIDTDQLGKVDIHEHIILDRSKNETIPEDFHHTDVDLISREVTAWKAAGGGAIVDSSPIDAGRNVELLNETSRNAQIPLIVTSGFHKLTYYQKDHWLYSASEDEIADILFAECEDGVLINDCHPHKSKRSSTKANMLKIGVDSEGVSQVQSKLINAVARTATKHEIPMMIHTEPGVPFDDLMQILERVIIDPGRVIICHMGKSLDFALQRTLAERGYYLEFDEMVRSSPPLPDLADAIISLFDEGFGDAILFAGDLARRGYWSCYGGTPGLPHLITALDEELKSLGFTQKILDQIWIKNPRTLFSH